LFHPDFLPEGASYAFAMKKNCNECGEAFMGRLDKRFCSDACRSTFHNRRNSDANNFVRNVNNILRKNRRILERLNARGKAYLHRDRLLAEGFQFNYFTNEYRTKSGNLYRFVYEQGYILKDDGYLTLVVRQEYVE
jgi:hypothetical protein